MNLKTCMISGMSLRDMLVDRAVPPLPKRLVIAAASTETVQSLATHHAHHLLHEQPSNANSEGHGGSFKKQKGDRRRTRSNGDALPMSMMLLWTLEVQLGVFACESNRVRRSWCLDWVGIHLKVNTQSGVNR